MATKTKTCLMDKDARSQAERLATLIKDAQCKIFYASSRLDFAKASKASPSTITWLRRADEALSQASQSISEAASVLCDLQMLSKHGSSSSGRKSRRVIAGRKSLDCDVSAMSPGHSRNASSGTKARLPGASRLLEQLRKSNQTR